MDEDEKFEAISHHLRIKILRLLSKRPMEFSELKRELDIKSSGKLDFHLKKLRGLITMDKNGRYTLTKDGYSALQAVDTIRKYGWQKRAYIINLIAYLIVNITFFFQYPSIWMVFILPVSTIWIIFYSIWSIVHRKIFRRV